MRKFFFCIVLLPTIIYSQTIPEDWVERALKITNIHTISKEMIFEFQNYIKPINIPQIGKDKPYPENPYTLKLIKSVKFPLIIICIGDYYTPWLLCFVEKSKSGYKLIYSHEIDQAYNFETPDFMIINENNNSVLTWAKQLYARGTGYFKDYAYFFSYKNHKVNSTGSLLNKYWYYYYHFGIGLRVYNNFISGKQIKITSVYEIEIDPSAYELLGVEKPSNFQKEKSEIITIIKRTNIFYLQDNNPHEVSGNKQYMRFLTLEENKDVEIKQLINILKPDIDKIRDRKIKLIFDKINAKLKP